VTHLLRRGAKGPPHRSPQAVQSWRAVCWRASSTTRRAKTSAAFRSGSSCGNSIMRMASADYGILLGGGFERGAVYDELYRVRVQLLFPRRLRQGRRRRRHALVGYGRGRSPSPHKDAPIGRVPSQVERAAIRCGAEA
jgi:hypothetical protein